MPFPNAIFGTLQMEITPFLMVPDVALNNIFLDYFSFSDALYCFLLTISCIFDPSRTYLAVKELGLVGEKYYLKIILKNVTNTRCH
jgi:hypothetical protein